MGQRSSVLDDRLFLPSLQAPEPSDMSMRQRVAELERLFAAAQEEIALLTSERDELIDAVKKWAKADRLERQELLFETTTQELRSELKQLRSAVKRLKRENNLLTNQANNGQQPLQMRA
jgi:predicted RNase H-like nuclease (RuvC/YqgF family)